MNNFLFIFVALAFQFNDSTNSHTLKIRGESTRFHPSLDMNANTCVSSPAILAMEYWKNLSLQNIEGEIWKDIQGYENVYQISNKARIKSLSREKMNSGRWLQVSKEKILSQSHTNRYLEISLDGKDRRSVHKVHRLVAFAFVPNPNQKPQVNHLDGIRFNNLPDNLEWCTSSENVSHAYKTGLKNSDHLVGSKCHFTKLTEEVLLEVRRLHSIGHTNNKIADTLNLKISNVSHIVTRRNWKHI